MCLPSVAFNVQVAFFLCFTFHFAHRARCAAAIRLLPAAEILRLGFGGRPLVFAQRAFCARLIFLRAAADMV
jgi:hypothetical protein